VNTQTNPIQEKRLQDVAHQFRYPSTPDVTGVVMKYLDNGGKPEVRLRSAWIVTGLLVLVLSVLFVVPGVRAEIVRFFQVGVVRIFPADATLTATSSATTPMPSPESTRTPRGTSTPFTFQSEPLYSVTTSDLAGETSLDAARESLPFPIRLPTYPPDLGMPDRVFLQENGQLVILVWIDPDDPDKVRFSLHEIGPESMIIGKFEPRVIQETQVNGNYAVWVQGPYLVQLTNDTYNWRRLVAGNTLIWEIDEITYRLESDLPLEETVWIAESLR